MSACPRCGRPLAVAGPRCLYCGAPIGAAAPKEQEERAPVERTESDRALLIVELAGDPATLAALLGLSRHQAERRIARGGFHLYRTWPAARAVAEAGRLGEQGLAAFVVPEAEALAAAHPQLVPGGRLEQGALHVLVDDHEENVQPTDLLLIVRGDIVREYQTRDKTRRVSAATLETGHRIHLHRRAGGSPLELDPGNFEFLTTDGPATSSLLRLAGWVEAVRGAAPLDLDFRWLAPALGPASAPAGRLGAVEALRGQPRAASAPLVLDNLRQFRLYSGWRACVERRRARREA